MGYLISAGALLLASTSRRRNWPRISPSFSSTSGRGNAGPGAGASNPERAAADSERGLLSDAKECAWVVRFRTHSFTEPSKELTTRSYGLRIGDGHCAGVEATARGLSLCSSLCRRGSLSTSWAFSLSYPWSVASGHSWLPTGLITELYEPPVEHAVLHYHGRSLPYCRFLYGPRFP